MWSEGWKIKLWNHTIEIREVFVPRRGKVYLLSREEQEEMHEFISEQLRKGYIRLSKSLQIVPVMILSLLGLDKRTTLVLE